MSTHSCEHSIGTNPRAATACVKCGKTLDGRWLRDLEREADLIQRAAGPMVSVEDLIQLAQSRAGAAQVRSLGTRSFFVECREELADAVNYLAWLDDQRVINGEEGLRSNELAALHHVVQAWKWLHSRGFGDE